MGSIIGIATDAKSSVLVTAGEDRTIRVWDPKTGQRQGVLHIPIGSGTEGKLNAIALSPDGARVAVCGQTQGGNSDFAIYVLDRVSGRMLKRVGGMPAACLVLTWSADGKFVGVGLDGAKGIRVFRSTDFALLGEDSQYGGPVRGLDFNSAGRLLVTSDDKALRIYQVKADKLALLQQWKVPGSVYVAGVAFSPDGKRVAVADNGCHVYPTELIENGPINLFAMVPNYGLPSICSRMAWSRDGKRLYATGGPMKVNNAEDHAVAYIDLSSDHPEAIPVLKLDAGGQEDVRALAEGGMIYAVGDRVWRMDDATDRITRLIDGGATIRFRRLYGFVVSDNGAAIGWPTETGAFQFDLSTRSVSSKEMKRPADRTNAMDLPHGSRMSPAPIHLHGREVRLEKETPESVDTAPDEKSFIVATERSLRKFDDEGNPIWVLPQAVTPWIVNISGDGKLFVVAFDDGVIRWFRYTDGTEILGLYVQPDFKEWVAWTPSGYYDASANGEDLIGWQLNHGPSSAADFYPISRFSRAMRRPDVIDHAIDALDESFALKLANAASHRNDKKTTPETVLGALPPVIDLLSAPQRFSTREVSVLYRVRTPNDAPLLATRVKVNGEWQSSARAAVAVAADDSRRLKLLLPPKDSHVEIYADNNNGRSAGLEIDFKWDSTGVNSAGNQGQVTQRKPRLFAVAIGVSKYSQPGLALRFADKDAEQFAAVMRAQVGKQYSETNIKLLTNTQASLREVSAALKWLRSQVAAEDIGILFLSGHGFQFNDRSYFFAPVDFDPAHPRETGLEYTEIRDALGQFAASGNRALFFIDTCYAGGALGPEVNASSGSSLTESLRRREYGIVVFSASTGDQESLETEAWANGAFTKALLEGVGSAKADPAASGEITVLGLGTYISRRVRVLTDDRQTPVLMLPDGGVADFALATTR